MASQKPPAAPGRSVQSIDRALDILLAFTAAHPQLTLGELAEAVGLPLSSTHRIARTLVDRGFIVQDGWGTYALGARLLELGGLVSNTSTLTQITAEPVRAIAETTGETILVAEVNWIDNTVVIAQKVDSVHPLSVASPVGKRSSLGSGCIGKAVLAGLPVEETELLLPRIHLVRRTPASITDEEEFAAQIGLARARGWASETEEYMTGVAGVAVSVAVGEGRPLGALGVIVPTVRGSQTRLAELGRQLSKLVAAAARSALEDNSNQTVRKER